MAPRLPGELADTVDHLVSDRLGLGYVRYGDDMLAFGDRTALRESLVAVERTLAAREEVCAGEVERPDRHDHVHSPVL